MKFALRRTSILVAASAILGCTPDSPVSPQRDAAALVVPTSDKPAGAVPVVAVAAEQPAIDSANTDGADASPVSPTGNVTIGTTRYAREQSLGFQRTPGNDQCLNEGDTLGSWRLRYSGYGCVGMSTDAQGTALTMQPMTATAGEETHAPLLLGPEFGDHMSMTARFETVQQLRQNGDPNAWEVAWLLWHYQDDQHFYYFIAKPNGWEVGKRDPAYPGGQRFLATGTAQKFPVGRAVSVQITHRGNAFSVTVDGVLLTTFADVERPYVSGRVALYSEDAEVRVQQVNVRSGAF